MNVLSCSISLTEQLHFNSLSPSEKKSVTYTLLENPKASGAQSSAGGFLVFGIVNFYSRNAFMYCPNCESTHVVVRHQGRKAGGLIGGITGASGLMSGAELGGKLGLLFSPLGSVVGMFTGAVIGAVAGANLGGLLDEKVLDNYHCLHCDYCFSHH